MDDDSVYATGQSEPLLVDLGAGAWCGGLTQGLFN